MELTGLRDRVVLVTGASSGIGRAVAVALAGAGARVVVNHVGPDEGARETADLMRGAAPGARPLLAQADVADEGQVAAMVARAVERLGRVDMLVNNAGIQSEAPSERLALEDWERVLAVNLRGAFLCAREVVRHLLERGGAGAIVNVSSVHEVIPKPGFLPYSVSKGGMQNLTRTLALEYARRGIRVNAVAPGATVTPINEAWIADPEARRRVEEHIPMGRAGTPEEMAAATAFLLSDQAAYVTGQTLFVDGGLTLYPSFRENWSS